MSDINIVGFLGYGNMGSAILEGLIEQGVLSGRHVAVFDPSPEAMKKADALGVILADSPQALVGSSDAVILAVKPQMMEAVIQEVKPSLKPNTLLVSIAAGLPISFFEKNVGPGHRIVRVMPNTPAMVNAGATGIALSENCSQEDGQWVRTIFEAVGIAEIVDENMIDVVTALSGSGPAYYFYMVECMIRAAEEAGLSHDTAHKLAIQTLLGAGQLLSQSNEEPEVLRTRVTSPGGTTEAALNRLKDDGFEVITGAAIQAAVRRAHELAKHFD